MLLLVIYVDSLWCKLEWPLNSSKKLKTTIMRTITQQYNK